MNKKKCLFVFIMIVAVIAMIKPVYAKESNEPSISNVALSKTDVYHGELITVSLDVIDESDIKSVTYYFQREGKGFAVFSSDATKISNNRYQGTFGITDDFDKTSFALGVTVCDIYDNCTNQTNIMQMNVMDGEKLDLTGPVVESIKIDKETVKKDDIVTVTMLITDESEIRNVGVSCYKNGYGNGIGTVTAEKQADGTYVARIRITDDYANGYRYYVNPFAEDEYGNSLSSYSTPVFTVDDSSLEKDVIGPVVESIKIDKETVKKDDIVTVTMLITDESEIRNVGVSCYKNGYGNSIETIIAEKQADGTYVARIRITDDYANGYRYYVNPFAEDEYGNSLSSYSTPVFTVDDSSLEKDVTGPVLESIEVDKSTVKKGDTIKVTMVVVDDSDINYVRISTYKNGYGNSIETIIAEKQADGKYVAYINIGDLYGYHWYLIIPSAEDIYGNSLSRYNDGKFTVFEEFKHELLNANTVSFKDNLSLNFLAELSTNNIEGTYVKFKYNHYGENKEVIVPINVNDKNGNYYRFRCSLTASEMMIPVIAELYLKDSTEPVSTFTRSIREYIIAGLNNPNASNAEKALFRATLNYGGYTQKRFNYNGSPYAYDDYKDNMNSVNISSQINFERPDGFIGGIKYYGSSVFFRNAPYVRYYFELENDNIGEYTFKIGNTIINPIKKDGRYYIESSPSLAYQLDDEQLVTIIKDETNIMSFNYSIIKWAQIADQSTTNDDERNMARAMYSYYLAAKTFVENNS